MRNFLRSIITAITIFGLGIQQSNAYAQNQQTLSDLMEMLPIVAEALDANPIHLSQEFASAHPELVGSDYIVLEADGTVDVNRSGLASIVTTLGASLGVSVSSAAAQLIADRAAYVLESASAEEIQSALLTVSDGLRSINPDDLLLFFAILLLILILALYLLGRKAQVYPGNKYGGLGRPASQPTKP